MWRSLRIFGRAARHEPLAAFAAVVIVLAAPLFVWAGVTSDGSLPTTATTNTRDPARTATTARSGTYLEPDADYYRDRYGDPPPSSYDAGFSDGADDGRLCRFKANYSPWSATDEGDYSAGYFEGFNDWRPPRCR